MAFPLLRVRWTLLASAACAVWLAGCSLCGPMFTGPGEVDDPWYLSPRYRARFGPPRFARPAQPAQRPPVELGTPQAVPFGADTDFDGPTLLGPEPVEDDRPATGRGEPPPPTAAKIELSVEAPERLAAGSQVLFTITVRNGGSQDLNDVVIETRFDVGLRFPGHADRRVLRRLGRLPAGRTQTAALTLEGTAPGRQCASFLVMAAGREAAWKIVCVEFGRQEPAIDAPSTESLPGFRRRS